MDMRLALVLAALPLTGCLIPRTPFSESVPPAAPSYSDEAAWAALPWRDDGADRLAAGETNGQEDAAVDVFFIHPTTYYSGKSWNQPLDHEGTNDRTDGSVLPNQASAFNGHARVFAPRYRQATLGSYLGDDHASRDAALDLAYHDVLEAFDHYLAEWNEGRPIVIAGHSQGAQHAFRLLSERFSERAAMRERLVAGYVIGATIPTELVSEALPGLPLCSARGETGCWVVWNTVRIDTAPSRFDRVRMWAPSGPRNFDRPTLACTNPVTGAGGDAWSEREDHAGAARLSAEGDDAEVHRKALSARCASGLLEVKFYDDDVDVRGDDLHIHDYDLFRGDIRRDLAARVSTFTR